MDIKGKALILLVFVIAIVAITPLVMSAETSDSGDISVTVSGNVEINVTPATMNFVFSDANSFDQNGVNGPFLIENAGSVAIDVSGGCSSHFDWDSDTNADYEYKWQADQNEPDSCTGGLMPIGGDMNWADFNFINEDLNHSTQICEQLETSNDNDTINVGILLRPPSDETAGSFSATVTFFVAQDTSAVDNAYQTDCNIG